MFEVSWINPVYFLVRVNRAAQLEKRTRKGSLYLDVQGVFMKFNQQSGEIMAIGQGKKVSVYQNRGDSTDRVPVLSAQEALPEARVGDTLLFNHYIEGSVETRNAEQRELDLQYLAHQDETWRWYWVKHDFAYGVAKADGSIHTTAEWILARPVEEEKDNRETVQVGNLLLLKNFKESHQAMLARIEELKQESMTRTSNEAKGRIMAEMEKLTRQKNKKRYAAFHPLHYHSRFARDCGQKLSPADIVYYMLVGGENLDLAINEIEYQGITYAVLKVKYVEAVLPVTATA